MVKSKKLQLVPGTVFTRSELDYINKCALSIPYELDVSLATILIPPSHSESYRDNLHVLHLINQFGFTAQVTIGAVTHALSVFNPPMKSGYVKPVDEPDEVVIPKRGEIWIHSETKQRYYFDKVDKDSMRVKFLGSLINDKTFKLSDIDFLVRGGHLVKEER